MSRIADWAAIGDRSLVAIVGAGGKTTTMHTLAAELAGPGRRVVIGTTTKMGRDQDHGITIVDADVTPPAALRDHDLALVMSGRRSNENKLGGPEDDWFDRLFASVDPDGRPTVDHVVLEADGARRRNVKAPAPHEPVIPARTTHVIVVIGADALDRVIEDQAHRPMRVAAAAGCSPYDRLTADRAARLLTHPDLGGRKDVPTDAWFGVLISKVGPAEQRVADDLAAILRSQALPVHQVPLRPRP